MIELDEKDVKAVGRSRFIRKHEKWLITAFIGCLIATALFSYGLRDFENFLKYLVIIPIIGLLVYIVHYAREMARAEKEFVGEWKKDK